MSLSSYVANSHTYTQVQARLKTLPDPRTWCRENNENGKQNGDDINVNIYQKRKEPKASYTDKQIMDS